MGMRNIGGQLEFHDGLDGTDFFELDASSAKLLFYRNGLKAFKIETMGEGRFWIYDDVEGGGGGRKTVYRVDHNLIL